MLLIIGGGWWVVMCFVIGNGWLEKFLCVDYVGGVMVVFVKMKNVGKWYNYIIWCFDINFGDCFYD